MRLGRNDTLGENDNNMLLPLLTQESKTGAPRFARMISANPSQGREGLMVIVLVGIPITLMNTWRRMSCEVCVPSLSVVVVPSFLEAKCS